MDPSPSAPTSDWAARRAALLRTPRIARELETIEAMLRIYCRDHHGAASGEGHLCEPCTGLLDYARQRLAACTFGAEKPTCVNCPVHCYGRQQREAVRVVMRYAGPRMLTRHPLLALAHLIDGRRPAPPRLGSTRATEKPIQSEPPP